MSERKQHEQWLRDVQDRQRSVVFPETLANETRLWRNILNGNATTLTWAGLAIFGLFVFSFIGFFLNILIQAGAVWVVALATLLVFGPIFGLIVWATRRNLRKLENSRHKSRAGKL
jgi:ABC-type nickel/cobalt efflux system permease component RcnA